MTMKMKRTISIILALVLMAALFVPALADGGKRYCDYDYYMCVGDSIAAGCALSKDGSESVFDQSAEDPYYIYDGSLYIGYDFSKVPQAYHSLVANELGAELLQCARSGLRAVEFRYMLEGVYNDFDTDLTWGNTYFDTDSNGFDMADLDAINEQVNYVEQIKKADVLSLNIGSNDVFSFTLGAVLRAYSDEEDDWLDGITGESALLAAFGELIENMRTLGKLPELMSVMTSSFYDTYEQLEENWAAIIKKVYEINPDITVVGVGVYNPFNDFRLSDGSILNFSTLAAPIVNNINSLIKSTGDTYDNFYYADVVGTATYPMNYNDNYFWEYFTLKVHPTIAGHEFMAQQILAALPDAALPFTDIPEGMWCYDDVKYCYENGMMLGSTETTFDPDVFMTRGMVAAVLYRLSGSPDMSASAMPFTDVTPDRFCADAVKWAYANGIISGYSDGTFRPDECISRQQFAAMLYRYGCAFDYIDKDRYYPPLLSYSDRGDVADYAKTAMRWAVYSGVVKGRTLNTLDPTGFATRAQCAVMLARFDRNVVSA